MSDARINVKLNQKMERIADLVMRTESVGNSPTAAVEHTMTEWFQRNFGGVNDAIRHALHNGLIREDDEIHVLEWVAPPAGGGFRSGYWPVEIGGLAFEVYASVNPRGYDSLNGMYEAIEDQIRTFMIEHVDILSDDGERYRYTSQSRYAE